MKILYLRRLSLLILLPIFTQVQTLGQSTSGKTEYQTDKYFDSSDSIDFSKSSNVDVNIMRASYWLFYAGSTYGLRNFFQKNQLLK